MKLGWSGIDIFESGICLLKVRKVFVYIDLEFILVNLDCLGKDRVRNICLRILCGKLRRGGCFIEIEDMVEFFLWGLDLVIMLLDMVCCCVW